MANPQEAREVIDRLGLTYARMDFDTQFRLSLLAKHVPNSGARFIFELLQNADNNRFVKANSKGEVPFIRFKVWPDKIIAECNEDGFTAEDVEALCAVGKSTKTTMHGYIGAKGIGFKSVFIAASRVHIQSGHFSFEFKRNSTDSGLFMVLPSWRVPEVTTFGPTTRMTLWLHTDGNAEQITSRNAFLMKQLDDLDVICLLFLKNLGSISVEQYDGKGESVRRRSFTKRNLRNNRIALKTILSEGGHVTTRSHFYHVTRQNATGLPFSSNWYMQASPDNSRPETTADVVLAFPLSAESQPVTDETQHLFAFLPIKKSNYKFLIHSDFDTNIDRNDILVYSKRNHSLLDWITKAFTRAALQFSEEEAMRYKWPVFLPTDEGRASSYWSKLDRMIQESIKSTPLFKSRQGAHFRKIHDLGWIPEKAIIPNGEPIIQSRTTDVWLSDKYTEEALEILGTEYYGLQRFGAVLMDLLKEDTMSDDSRMYSKATSAEWHSLVAESLLYESSAYEGSAKLHHLAIIPLRGGEWVTSEKQFFWPFIGSVTIPTEVDLPILDPAAVADLSRKRLFQHLGAKFATVAQVTELIFSGFKRGVNFVSLECAIERLHFLYLTSPAETLGNTSNPNMYRGKVYLFNSRLERVWPHTHEIYISGEKHPYHPQILLSGTNTHFVDYVHPFMLRHQPQRPSPRHLLWVEWLHEFLCVRSRVSLFNDSLTDISEAARHVLFYKPLTFLVFLEYLWKQLPESAKTDRAKAIIRGLDVRTICGKRRRLTLQYTRLPTPKLHDVLSRYLENPGDFKSFLRIEGFNASTNAPVSKWSFLCRDFSVDNENNLRFLVHILEDLSNSPRVSRIQLQKLCKLYSAIYDRFVLAKDQVQAKESLV